MSDESLQHWLDHCFDDATAAEVEALRRWTTREYEAVQQQLITGRLDAGVAELVTRIDSALRRHPLPDSLVGRRMDSPRRFGVGSADDLYGLAGRIVASPGYVALSMRPRGIRTQPDAVVPVVARVAEGTPAAYLRTVSAAPRQREVLVVRNVWIQIDDVVAQPGGLPPIVHVQIRPRGVES